MRNRASTSKTSDPLRDAALETLSRLLEPLLKLMFDSRVTVREFTQLLRKLAVQQANLQISRDTGQSNKSRVSILTGMPRSEVTRLLKKRSSSNSSEPIQHPTRKLLSAWFDDSAYLTKEGDPAILPAFGRRRSFERLVEKYGGGVPVRAMLDELTRINAIEWLDGQRIRPRNRIPTITGLTASSILMMGERGRNLLDTLLANAHAAENPFFEATAFLEHADAPSISMSRREVLQQGSNFINGIDGLFDQLRRASSNSGRAKKGATKRIGVSVFYFEDVNDKNAGRSASLKITPRRNLRRN